LQFANKLDSTASPVV